MAPSKHSTFSASSAARLLACPGSYDLGLRADDGTRKSSVYSAEGTLAHAMAEACIYSGQDVVSFLGQSRTADGFTYTVDDEFAEFTQTYVDYVRALRAMGFAVMLETRVSPQVQWEGLPKQDVDLFGTADCIAYHPDMKTLVIGDLKYGRGVPVEVAGNAQLLYYASGAAHENVLRALCDASGVTFNGLDHVTITVIQPRAPHRDGPVRRAEYSPDFVREWARTTLYDGVKAALADKGQTLSAGDHCRFCPVLPHCAEPRRVSFEAAQQAFRNTPVENFPAPDEPGAALPDVHLTDKLLGEILDKIEIVEPWLAAVRRLGQERLEAGRSIDGWKLVPKRALRRWAGADDDEVIATLSATGMHADQFTTVKPLTPAQVEKRVGKKEYAATIAPHVVKTSSGMTLASEGDPRIRLRANRSPQEAFGLTTPTPTPTPTEKGN